MSMKGRVIDLSRAVSDVAETEKLTQDTFLADIDLCASDDERFSLLPRDKEDEDAEIPGHVYQLHNIVTNESWTSEVVTKTAADGTKKKVPSRKVSLLQEEHCVLLPHLPP